MTKLEIIPLEGIPEISPGDDLVEIIGQLDNIQSGDILVVTQKIISKAENQMIKIDPNDPLSHKPLVERESVRILRRRGDLIISQTKHGFVCANAGIDLSNVERGQAALLPDDSDRSARRLRDGLAGRFQLDVGIIISDTFGRPWRRGLTDVAIGSAGVLPILDLRGSPDAFGRDRVAAQRDILTDRVAPPCSQVVDQCADRHRPDAGKMIHGIGVGFDFLPP